MEWIDPEGRVYRQILDRDGMPAIVQPAFDRVACSSCGWKTSRVVGDQRPSPTRCLCGGRLVRIG